MSLDASLPRTRQHSAIDLPLAVATIVVSFITLDNLRLFGTPILTDIIILETHFYYALLGLLLPFCFLTYRSNTKRDLLALDCVLAAITFIACAWLFLHGEEIVDEGWEFLAPDNAIVMSYLLWVLTLEAVRRAAGTTLFVLVLVFSLYPIYAGNMPEMLQGISIGIAETAAYHVMSIESLLGIPFRAFANLVIGFLVFGVALQYTGGGQFFIDLSFALLGRVRGGPAKVAIVSSGLMGSMSGSVITNVVTTGQLTIPAMKENGFEPKTAGAVESCASTGGVLLPPIMGSTAFVMATFLSMPYYQVALAAAVPALLYFTALFLQIDLYAARHGLKGIPAADLPKAWETLKSGWYYIASFVLLVVLLLVMQRESLAPWAATACLLVVNQFSKEHRFNPDRAMKFVIATGRLLVELLAILAGVGLIVGALSVTGLSGTLINDLLFIAGGSIGVLLLMGALTSFILGIGMTVTAAYIFLAIVLAPALIEGGLNPVAVHLFILYWGMLSFITPPVALGAFAAASIARANPVATGFTAMRLGIATYLIPFLFVIQPALILEGSSGATLLSLIEALAGIFLVAAAAQKHVPGIGSIGTLAAIVLGIAGMLVALPDMTLLGLGSNLLLLILGGVLAGVAFGLARFTPSP